MTAKRKLLCNSEQRGFIIDASPFWTWPRSRLIFAAALGPKSAYSDRGRPPIYETASGALVGGLALPNPRDYVFVVRNRLPAATGATFLSYAHTRSLGGTSRADRRGAGA